MDDVTRKFCVEMRDRFYEVTSVAARKAVERLAGIALDADEAVQRLRREAEHRYVSCCDCVYCEFGKREATVPLEVFAKLVAAAMPKEDPNA
jgi:hypothetical protein